MMTHDVAKAGYSAEAKSYERGRPTYPSQLVDELLDSLGIDADSRILDIGAGTGKLTRLLVDRVAWTGAVEPVAAMRKQLVERVPRAVAVAGVAELLPFGSHSVDAVLCGQTFHWLDGATALAEFARVLRPGAALGLIWNVKDETVTWVAELEAVIDEAHRAKVTPRYKTGRWRLAFDRASGWQSLRTRSISHAEPTTGDDVIARALSSSAVGALDEEQRERTVEAVRQILARHSLDGPFAFPYQTEIWWTRPG